MGRFLNADAFTSTGQGILGNNMFAYCGNNPVNCSDLNGKFPLAIVLIIAGCAIIGGIMGALSEKRWGSTANERVKANERAKRSDQNVSIDANTQKETETLTAKDRAHNIFVGISLGLAVGGAVVATAGAAATVAAGSASVYITALGATGAQTFAWGAVVYDFVAMVLAPVLGAEMETIEIE